MTALGPWTFYKNEQKLTKMNMFLTKMNTFFVHFCKVGFIPPENREKIMQRTCFSKNVFCSLMQRTQKFMFFKKLFSKKVKLDILKMSKNENFKILFDKKTLNKNFHNKKPDKNPILYYESYIAYFYSISNKAVVHMPIGLMWFV